jgi:elongator complex protein 3
MSYWYTTSIIWTYSVDLSSKRNFVCLDTRSREIRHRVGVTDEIFLVIRQYDSSAGKEFFVAREDTLWYLYGFIRLFLPFSSYDFEYIGVSVETALIRELHVYGQVSKIGETNHDKTQHTWLWKQLLDTAQKIAFAYWYTYLSVISGVGVKWYYARLWFERKGTYMTKKL